MDFDAQLRILREAHVRPFNVAGTPHHTPTVRARFPGGSTHTIFGPLSTSYGGTRASNKSARGTSAARGDSEFRIPNSEFL
jgi:hypothetical protein